jgi:hyperosmotically inducible protein
MKNSRRFTVLVILAGIFLSVFACQTPAGRSPGEVFDDGTITSKVKAKLFRDPVVSGFAVSVQTFQGEVTLIGAVDSPKTRQRAEILAREVPGVRKVHNLLKIK